jgi:hypothetical protein
MKSPDSAPRPIRLKVASPCKVPWDSMQGDDAVRFCGSCQKNVYNLSAMSIEQTEQLLASPSGTPCVRFFQRADGTVMTNDCPVGAQRVRRQRVAFGIGAGLMSAVGFGAIAQQGEPAPKSCQIEKATRPPAGTPAPAAVEPSDPVEPIELMGEPMPVEEVTGKIASHERLTETVGVVAPTGRR